MELAQCDWSTYFRSITGEPQCLLVAVESVGPRTPLEERIDAMCEGVCTRHPLRAMCYEQHADVFEVAVGLNLSQGPLLRYFVAAPRRISVREVNAARAIVVSDSGGGRTLVCVFQAPPWDSHTAVLTRPQHRNHVRSPRSGPAAHPLARVHWSRPAWGHWSRPAWGHWSRPAWGSAARLALACQELQRASRRER